MTAFKSLKSLFFALVAALSLQAWPGHAAGTVPLAMAQQVDVNGQPLAGCILYFFVAGTVATPQNSYSDFGLSQNPNPQVTCDQSGRIPMFWLADGLIHIRLTDSGGVPVIDTTMQVLGPSSGGGGGGGTVDPTTIASTGDMKIRRDKSVLTGWVRVNGLTIGSAVSGATERANADTQNLFVYIWNTFSQPSSNVICPVVGGLGSTALADFNANKQITLDDSRARSLFAYDDMGNTALGGFTGVTFSYGTGTTAGAKGGTNATTLLLANLPPITPSGTIANGAITIAGGFGALANGAQGGGGGNAGTVENLTASQAASTFTGTVGGGSSAPIPSVPSASLITIYWKL